MKIVIPDSISPEGIDYLKKSGLEVCDRVGIPLQELLREISDADALIVRSKTQVTPQLIDAAGRLRVIGRAGAGVDNIDLEAATRRGIVVMNTPGGNSVSVAEHTFALLLSLARSIPIAHASLRAGEWKKSSFIGLELLGKTLGVIGLGKIGTIVAQRGQAFGMRILAYDPFVSEEFAKNRDIELRELDELLGEADFITLHLPLGDQTRGLINKRSLGLMKATALLVNAARGGLVVEQDLAEALENQTIAGAGLDVFANEPQVSPRLLNAPNLVATPHIAGSTVEAQTKVGIAIAIQIHEYLTQGVIRNAVNFPSVSQGEAARLGPYLSLAGRLAALIANVCGIRYSTVGIRYYGEVCDLQYKPISNRILREILRPGLLEEVNDINSRTRARERGLDVVETVSSRARSYSNLISIQLRNSQSVEWIEGALLHQGKQYLVSLDGIPVEAPLGSHMLLIRNQDRPGVIGQVGSLLGKAGVNIASFVLGRDTSKPHAVGVINVDDSVPAETLAAISQIPAVSLVRSIELPPE